MRRPGIGLALLAAVGLVACSSAPILSEDFPTTAATEQPSPAATSITASPTSASTPISWGEATFVEGTLTFGFGDGTLTTDPDGTVHSRGGPLTETLTSNDPRVSGVATGTFNSDRWGSMYNGAIVQWGTMELVNDGGSWVGPFAGIYTSETGDHIDRWWVGKGGYEGLTFFMWISDPQTFAWQGLIYRGDPPPER